MYRITDAQIDFIAGDIRARGVGMQSLIDDLTDHVCCIIEERFEEGSNFELIYNSVISDFFKEDLSEIEDETKMLLNNQNYYTMKKVMISSGIISAIVLVAGLLFKFMHWPGAGVLITLGIGMFGLIFLPLMVLLKLKEKDQARDKALLITGTLVAIMVSMGTLFKIMHWPLANALGLSAVAILTLVYLPVNLFTGIRNPDTRVNTIVSSVLLVAGCGLFLSLVRSPQSSQSHYMQQTAAFVDLHEILNREKDRNNQSGHELSPEAKDVLQKCDQLEKYLLQRETGSKNLNTGNSGGIMITDNYLNVFIRKNNEGVKLLEDFKQSISDYNAASAGKNKVIDIEEIPAANLHDGRVIDALESLVRIQLHVLQGV